MRDDRHRWAPPRDRTAQVTAPGLTITPARVDRLTLLSGPTVRQQTKLPLVEWPGVAPKDSYALSLRRDRVLEVNGPEHLDGWDGARGQAVSNVTDGYAQVEITGANALSLLNRGADIDLSTPSRSVARLFFGFAVFLYRRAQEDTYRIHVSSAHEDAMWCALEDASKHLS